MEARIAPGTRPGPFDVGKREGWRRARKYRRGTAPEEAWAATRAAILDAILGR